jgi:AAA+ ATPase superfamily predicted ATPase
MNTQIANIKILLNSIAFFDFLEESKIGKNEKLTKKKLTTTSKMNCKNKLEVAKIINESEFITHRFHLTPNYNESDNRMLGGKLTKRIRFWQVDLRSITTVNIHKDFSFNSNQPITDLELTQRTA